VKIKDLQRVYPQYWKNASVLYLDLKITDSNSMHSELMELVDLIRKKESRGAKQLMMQHIESTRDRIFTKSFKK
jgi:DNA-binding GntR family transcriptional regulator